jgi:hypothetical protein
VGAGFDPLTSKEYVRAIGRHLWTAAMLLALVYAEVNEPGADYSRTAGELLGFQR